MASCLRASSSVPHIEGEVAQEGLKVSLPVGTVCDRSPMTVRGGGAPADSMACMPCVRMGPPPRSLLPMRITASWSGSLYPPAYKDVARAIVHHTRAPLDVVIPDPSQVCRHARSPQGRAFGGADAPSLTAPARCRRHQSWVGMKKRARPGRTKKLRDKKMDRTLGAPP